MINSSIMVTLKELHDYETKVELSNAAIGQMAYELEQAKQDHLTLLDKLEKTKLYLASRIDELKGLVK